MCGPDVAEIEGYFLVHHGADFSLHHWLTYTTTAVAHANGIARKFAAPFAERQLQ